MTKAIQESANVPGSDHDRVPETALDWHRAGIGAALATVVETWGSAPRPVGSMLAVSGRGAFTGSVSGGCVEGAVVAEAIETIQGARARLLQFGVSDEEAFNVGLACGGRIAVSVEPVDGNGGISSGLLAELVAARAAREGVVLASQNPALTPEAEADAKDAGALASATPTAPEHRILRGREAGALGKAASDARRQDRSGHVMVEGRTWFLNVHNPPLRMVVVGASHIAQPLIGMARLAGYDVLLVDPRDSFSTEERFPGVRIVRDWPDAALEAHGLDSRVAVVTLTHDPKLDDPAIEAALKSDVFYLGCLGSVRTHARRVERLRERGHPDAAIARICAPVGLDIGSRSPAEVAVAILAEAIASLRGTGGRDPRR